MKQNGVVRQPGPVLLFFIFWFEYLISGPKSYRDVPGRSRNGPQLDLSYPKLSPPQGPLCVVGRLGRNKKEARWARWEGGREKRGLCHIVWGCVLWFWLWFWMLLNAVVKIIVLKGSIRNLMGFRFCFTVFLQFMFFVFGAVVRHLG